MTAVAPPVTLQSNAGLGWSPDGNGFGAPDFDDAGGMFSQAHRKPIQRQNSSSSIASSTSTISGPMFQSHDTSADSSEAGNTASRKRPARGLWPPGKLEPATGTTTTRSHPISVAAYGASASPASSASSTTSPYQPPTLPSQKMASRTWHVNGVPRGPGQVDPPPAILHILPMNGTFERKTINVPYFPDVLRIGRQTNQKTIPTPLNGYFDSKVLSRQHAEVWADRQGRVFIRDVKSSNGTFVNGMRLSQENKESEPRELREMDVLELGIDIVSEDQKTVVHHKVAAKVEHAGVYGLNNDPINFGDFELGSGGGLMVGSHHLRRTGQQGSMIGRLAWGNAGAHEQAMGMGGVGMNLGMGMGMGMGAGVMAPPQHMRDWLNPITTEHMVKKLNAEVKLAMQQSQDLARAKQAINVMLGGKSASSPKDALRSAERSRHSPNKTKPDLMPPFSDPPAPPPQAPLPVKPDVARALADPVIQPLLRRGDTARPSPGNGSPTRIDHSSDILRLCEELKLAKGELNSASEKMKSLEVELAQERTARECAEERVQRLERRDSPTSSGEEDVRSSSEPQDTATTNDLRSQLNNLSFSMDEMKQTMEEYRSRAEKAETERDEARQSLAEMVEEKRCGNVGRKVPRTPPKTPSSSSDRSPARGWKQASQINGHAVSPQVESPTSNVLLERAGIEEGQPITAHQAKMLTQFLTDEVLRVGPGDGETNLSYHGRPYGSAAAVLIVGFLVMTWVNGWPKVER